MSSSTFVAPTVSNIDSLFLERPRAVRGTGRGNASPMGSHDQWSLARHNRFARSPTVALPRLSTFTTETTPRRYDVLKTLLNDDEIDVDERDSKGNTLLHVSVRTRLLAITCCKAARLPRYW